MKDISAIIKLSRGKIFCLLCTFAAILTGCSTKTTDETVVDDTIDFEPVAVVEQMAMPISMNVLGDTLYISVFHGDSLLNLYYEPTGQYIRSTIRRGNGPGEMFPPLQPTFTGDEVYVYSRPIMTMFKSDVKNIDGMRKVGVGPTMLSNLFAIGDNRFVGSVSAFGLDEKTRLDRYVMLDDSLNVIYTFGRYPSSGPNERADDADGLSHFHQTNNVMRYNDSTLIAVGKRDISFYTLGDDGRYRCRDIITVCPYDYTVTPATEMMSATTKLCEGYPRNICDAYLYKGNIILAILDGVTPSSSDAIYFEIRDGNTGKLIKRLTPTSEVTYPTAINSKGEILAMRNTDDAMIIVRSAPITD